MKTSEENRNNSFLLNTGRVLVSLIIPAYNVEKFVKRCLDSVKSQTLKNFECIIVDDGSSDNTYTICQKYCEADSRFILRKKENGGLGSARNEGLNIAKGEYIAFLDSDDYMEDNCLNCMITTALEYDADMVIAGYFEEQNNHVIKVQAYQKKTMIQGSENLLHAYLSVPGINGLAWNKIYKRYLFDEIRFPTIPTSEDNATTYKLMSNCFRAVYVPKLLFHYMRRMDSIDSIHLSTIHKHFISVDVAEERYSYISSRYPRLKKEADVNRWKMYYASYLRLFMCGGWIKYKEELKRYILFFKIHSSPSKEFELTKRRIEKYPYVWGIYIHIRYQFFKKVKRIIGASVF